MIPGVLDDAFSTKRKVIGIISGNPSL